MILRVAAVGIGLLIAVGLAEIVLRLFRLALTGGIITVTEPEFDAVPRVRIDSLGYRGSEFPRAKGAGEYRILMGGDSFTYGDFVDDSMTTRPRWRESLGRFARPAAACGSSTPDSAARPSPTRRG